MGAKPRAQGSRRREAVVTGQLQREGIGAERQQAAIRGIPHTTRGLSRFLSGGEIVRLIFPGISDIQENSTRMSLLLG